MTERPSMVIEAVAEPDGGVQALVADATAGGLDSAQGPDVVVVAVHPATGDGDAPAVDEGVEPLLAGWGVDLARRLRRANVSGTAAEITRIELEREHPAAVVALGLGAGTPGDARRAGASLVRRLRGTGDVLVHATRGLREPALEAFTEGLLLGLPAPTWATSPAPTAPGRVRLVVGDLGRAGDVLHTSGVSDAGGVGAAGGADRAGEGGPRDVLGAVEVTRGQRAIDVGRVRAEATLTARVLVHTPANVKGPAWLAGRAQEIGAAAGLQVRVLDEHDLAAQGFGGILAVGAGSVRPPRLVQMSWEPAGPGAARHVVLVGKGITFDSGGLSLKPAKMQIPMKTDMSGAAAVCAAMGALDRVQPGVRVTGLLCLAENLPGASAMRPGDVVTHHGGLTSEVLNTDAEGRLVLGDALDHAVGDLRADVVVDVATLTGAATLGLGRSYAALFSTSDVLAAALAEAGQAAGERTWRLPLHADYRDLIVSEVADQANANTTPGPGPGAITAALFLERFVGSTPWAHLDIAGVGRSDTDRNELPKGGTGFGARLLLRWLAAGAPA